MHKYATKLDDMRGFKAVWTYDWREDEQNYEIRALRDDRADNELPHKPDVDAPPGAFSSRHAPNEECDHGISQERAAQLFKMFGATFYFGITPR